MRLGEIKNIIAKNLDADSKFVISSESLYGNQAYNINNFGALIEALEILGQQSWNDINFTPIVTLKDKYGTPNKVLVTQDEFNQLTEYVSNINQRIPLFFSILNTIVSEQDERLINIKLPANTISFEKLTELNIKYAKLFKMFQLDAEFAFVGFDKGTDWYMVATVGYLSYNGFIACLHIAQEVLKTRTEYYNSEKAKLDYEASVKSEKDVSDEGLEKYQEKRIELIVREEVKKAVEALDSTNGSTKNELNVKLIKATTELVKILDEGTEFHLSLNPPDYAKEIGGRIDIDYLRMPKQVISNKKLVIEATTEKTDREG